MKDIRTIAGVGVWLVCLTAWIYFDCYAGDWCTDAEHKIVWVPAANYGVIKSLLRVLVIVPLCVELGIWAVNEWDRRTPECWWEIISNDKTRGGTKLAVAAVLCAVIYGVFWLAAQG